MRSKDGFPKQKAFISLLGFNLQKTRYAKKENTNRQKQQKVLKMIHIKEHSSGTKAFIKVGPTSRSIEVLRGLLLRGDGKCPFWSPPTQ